MRTLFALGILLLPASALAQLPAFAQLTVPTKDEVVNRAEVLATEQIKPPKRTLDLHLELGGSLTAGNTATKNVNAALAVGWAFADGWLSTTAAHALYQEATLPSPLVEGAQRTDTAVNLQVGERVDRYFGVVGAFAAAAWERNPFAGIGAREIGQLGVIFVALENKIPGQKPEDELVRERLQLEAGGYFAQETHVAVPHTGIQPKVDDQTILASRAAATFVYRFKKGSDAGATLEYIQDFKSTSNIVLQGGAYLASSFTDALALKLAITERWDHQPVLLDNGQEASKYDLLVTAGLLVNL